MIGGNEPHSQFCECRSRTEQVAVFDGCLVCVGVVDSLRVTLTEEEWALPTSSGI